MGVKEKTSYKCKELRQAPPFCQLPVPGQSPDLASMLSLRRALS